MTGLWDRLKRAALTDVGVWVKGLDRTALDSVERVLVEADFGGWALTIVQDLEHELRRGRLKSESALREWLGERVRREMPPPPPGPPLELGDGRGPAVVLLLGVNGVGKTTCAAKLAHRLGGEGRSVLLAAADTFRAGASEQLRTWADRLGVPSVTGADRSDPAAVAYDAVESATARGIDVVLVDTAGRLHSHRDLLAELEKIARVVGRRRAGAPHESLLVLDGTVGQNAIAQGRAFTGAVRVTGLVVTKLDGTAKGGAVARLPRELGVPLKFVGVGEGLDDLDPFDPAGFVARLLAD